LIKVWRPRRALAEDPRGESQHGDGAAAESRTTGSSTLDRLRASYKHFALKNTPMSRQERYMDVKNHWESIYSEKAATDVSWYQREASLSIQLIQHVAPGKTHSILDVGGGASTLVDSLISLKYADITVLDIAANALANARSRLGSKSERVRWIAGDVLTIDLPDHSVDVWHDRAVFHFLLLPEDRQRYVAQVRRLVRPNGHVIIATFAEDGPTRCSGLPVARYDAAQLHGEFGDDFQLLNTIREEHLTPGGGRQRFRYCLCSFRPSPAVAVA
jgi:ubiquinone/menaquinone biosynthesis C-methylase UbiE